MTDLINAKLWSRHIRKETMRDVRGDRYPGGRFAYAEALIERAERLAQAKQKASA